MTDHDNLSARKRRQRGAGSRERRRARRAIQNIAAERQSDWAARAVGRDTPTAAPFPARIADLTDELDDAYALHRREKQP